MLKIYRNIIFFFLFIFILFPIQTSLADNSLSGRILLQVESKGEAWYVNPSNQQRYFLGRPADAFNIMKKLGLGISNKDFNGLNSVSSRRLAGKILIKTEDSGKAYYLYPRDLKLYYLGRPADAFNIMKKLGLGISNKDLAAIPANNAASVTAPYSTMEKKIHEMLNQERIKNGLSALKWNSEVAAVARQHSIDQAEENQNMISNSKVCSFPFIHHEGMKSGIFHSQRLNSKDIYYFSASAENIALMPQIKEARYQSFADDNSARCSNELSEMNETYEKEVKLLETDSAKMDFLRAEIARRTKSASAQKNIVLTDIVYNSDDAVAKDAVIGWMNSPGHRRNILNGSYDEAGIGIATVKNYFIITQVFIKRAECGFKNGPCCQKPGYYPYCYIPLSCSNALCK